jgi:hypothetical protein
VEIKLDQHFESSVSMKVRFAVAGLSEWAVNNPVETIITPDCAGLAWATSVGESAESQGLDASPVERFNSCRLT